MTTHKITSEYGPGMAGFSYLMEMLGLAISEAFPAMQVRIAGGFGFRGFNLKNGTYWCGIRYSDPELLVFEDDYGYNPKIKHDFDLRATSFYNLDKDQQFEVLVTFVCRAAEVAGERHPAARVG